MKQKSARSKKFKEKIDITIGVDECGMGALAGDVYACAVILGKSFKKDFLRRNGKIIESKTINKNKIPEAATHVMSTCKYGLGHASPVEIDDLGIKKASKLAMKRALNDLITRYGIQINEVIVDGNDPIEDLHCDQRIMVKGDTRFYSIAAASIVAKYHRDTKISASSTTYPGYGFESNKGYATIDHISQLQKLGPSPIHRYSFDIVKRSGKRKGIK